MTTQYNVSKYTNGINGYSARFCDTNYNVTLAANTETTVTVPGATSMGMYGATNNKFLAQFSITSGKNVWVNINATAAKPVGNTLAACGSNVLNPNARLVNAGDVIHVITADTGADFGIEFYSLQE